MIDRFERFSFAISEISRCWHKIASDEMRRYGLKGAHAIYLTALFRCDEGITAPQLCELYGKDKADVSRQMAAMEEKGLVTKKGGYRAVYTLTAAGREAAETVQGRAAVAVDLAGRDLTDEARATMYAALDSVVANLRDISREGLPE